MAERVLPSGQFTPIGNSDSDEDFSKRGTVDSLSSGPLLLWTCLFLFVASGVCQPLLMSAMKYAGLADTACQIYMLPYCAGMAAVGFLTFCIPSKRWCEYPLYYSCAIGLIDICSQILNYTGNMYAGSAIFAVVYASVSVWCAVLSRIFLKRVLTGMQWFTVFVVFGGLAITAVDANAGGDQVLIGTLMVFVGAMLHALMYVLSEWISTRGNNTPPHIHCSTMAIVNTLLISTWTSTYTVSHFDRIARPVAEMQTTPAWVAFLFLATAVANFVHSATFFFLLAWVGAVSAAVMKGIQAVLVFVMADAIFCDYHYGNNIAHAQCFTELKGIALVVVLTGAFAYAYVTAKIKRNAARDAPISPAQGLCDSESASSDE